MTVIETLPGICLLVIYFGLFFLQKVDVEKWVCVSMDLQRNRDLNTCTFALASNISVWLPGVACTTGFHNNCCVVLNKYKQVSS